MKALLGVLVALVLVAGCGEESAPVAKEPARSTETPAAAEVVAIVSGSAAGGDVGRTVTILDSDAAVDRYVEQFRSRTFADDLREAVAAHQPEEGRTLGAVVMEVSCDPVPSATVTQVDGQYVVTPAKVPSPHPECYAAVTSVAVVDLPATAG